MHNLGSNDTLAQVSLSPEVGSDFYNGMSFEQDTFLQGSSSDELLRWTATAAPSTMELEPGEVGYGTVALAFNSNADYPYPSAGTLILNDTPNMYTRIVGNKLSGQTSKEY